MEVKNERNSNIEILRIIAIVMIIINHYFWHGIQNGNLSFINTIFSNCLKLGDIGVIIFILIFGYHYDKNKLRLNKVLNLLLEVLFYSISIYLILSLTKLVPFSIKELIKYIFPICFNKYWFMTVYLIIYILSPYLYKFIESLKRKEFLTFLITILITWSFIPTIFGLFGINSMYASALTDLFLIYFIGAYLKKYPDNIFNKNYSKMKGLIISLSLILIISVILLSLNKFTFIKTEPYYFLIRKSPIAILFAVSLFTYFNSKKVYKNAKINKIASLSLGIYLIHDHEAFRSILFKTLKVPSFAKSNFMLIHLIGCVLIIYCLSGLIEYLRQFIVKKYVTKNVEKAAFRIKLKFDKLNKLSN